MLSRTSNLILVICFIARRSLSDASPMLLAICRDTTVFRSLPKLVFIQHFYHRQNNDKYKWKYTPWRKKNHPTASSLQFAFQTKLRETESIITREKEKTETNNPYMRAIEFWKRAGPIIAHYKFTELWLYQKDNMPKMKNTVASGKELEIEKEQNKKRRDLIYGELHDKYAPEVYDIMSSFRGLFVKIGQVLSSRVDFVPRAYTDRFIHLQDSLPPRPFEEIKETIIDSLSTQHEDLSFDDVFLEFDEDPLGTASIGQVHSAILNPKFMKEIQKKPSNNRSISIESMCYKGGPKVAVKVMNPYAQTQFMNDFKILKWVCKIALPGWTPLLQEMKQQVSSEFDYRKEASDLNRARHNLYTTSPKKKYHKRVVIPQPVMELGDMKNVLVMEYLEGKKLPEFLLDQLAKALGNDVGLAKEIIVRKREELMNSSHDNVSNLSLSDNNLDNSNRRKTNRKLRRKEFMAYFNEIKKITSATTSRHRYGKMKNEILVYSEGEKSFRDQLKDTIFLRTRTLYRLWSMNRKINKTLELLLAVHGNQIFIDGFFNSDPHPGNILMLHDGRLGLLDYGQTKELNSDERIAFSKLIIALNDGANHHPNLSTQSNKLQVIPENRNSFDTSFMKKAKINPYENNYIHQNAFPKIANAMRNFGFESKYGRDEILTLAASFYYDSTDHAKESGFVIPALYLTELMEMDPMVNVPKAGVMLARGLGAMLNKNIKTAQSWADLAQEAIRLDKDICRM